MCNNENCNCGGNPCYGDCEPWNCVERAVNDVWSTKQGQITGLVDRAETAADNSEISAKASADSAVEAREFRDEAELAATTAVAAQTVVVGVATSLQNTADSLEQSAEELGNAIAGITVVTWYYTAVSENQTVIPVPEDKNQIAIQAIYVEGVRKEPGPGRDFTYDPVTKQITLVEGIPLGQEIAIILGIYPENSDDITHILASSTGAGLIGTSTGETVQENLDVLNAALDPTWQRLAAESGLEVQGTFENGLTITSATTAVVYKKQGKLYKWAGSLPKIIAENSTPDSSGGISPTAWVEVTQDTLRGQLASDLGSTLVGYNPNLANAIKRSVSDKFKDSLSVKDFGAVGNWDPVNKEGADDTIPFKSAMAVLQLLGGGSLHIPAGDYLVRAVEIPSNVYIYGDGWATSLWQVEEPWNSTVVCFGTNLTNLNRPDFSQNTSDILIENIAFRRKNRDTHTSGTDVAQYRHLISLNATTRFAIEGCLFEGFNGDGIYVAGGVGTNEGHNFYGRINRCVFEGIDMQNRNGVSIIDCEGLEISQCFFRACSSPYQPGPIDIEPNANTFHRIRDININNCRFVACGGGSAGLCIAIPDVAYGVRPTGITFKDNIIDGASHTTSRSAIRIMWGGLSLAAQNLDVTISGNKITRCQRPFDISGTSNVRLLDNHFWDITNPAIIGVADTNRRCKNTVLEGNIFRDVGANEGACIAIFNVEDLLISNNQFRNIGKTTAPASGEVLIFKAGGVGSSIRIVDNTFINEGATITSAISSTGYTFTANSNEFRDNLYLGGGGLSNRNFPALYGNEGEVNYNPTVYGDTVEGAGTYTVRNGRYHIEGSVVHYRLNVTLSAHSGSGPMNVTLPTKCAVNGATAPMTAWVSGNIASAIGIAAARIDGGTLGAVGRARIYRADGAGNINISSAGTALSVEVSGTYHLDAS